MCRPIALARSRVIDHAIEHTPTHEASPDGRSTRPPARPLRSTARVASPCLASATIKSARILEREYQCASARSLSGHGRLSEALLLQSAQTVRFPTPTINSFLRPR